jgi:ABC-type transport system substrate-binding protein
MTLVKRPVNLYVTFGHIVVANFRGDSVHPDRRSAQDQARSSELARLPAGARDTWSNGTPITPQDLAFGFAVDKDKASGPYCDAGCNVIAHIDPPGKYTAVLRLKHVDAAFLGGGLYPEIWPTKWPGAWSNAHEAAIKLWQTPSFNFEDKSYPTSGPFQVALFAFLGGADPDPLKEDLMGQFIDRTQSVHSAINQNYSGVHDSAIDSAFTRASATLNNAVRARYYAIAQTRVNQNADWIMLYYRPVIATSDSHVKNVTDVPTQFGPEWNTWAWHL